VGVRATERLADLGKGGERRKCEQQQAEHECLIASRSDGGERKRPSGKQYECAQSAPMVLGGKLRQNWTPRVSRKARDGIDGGVSGGIRLPRAAFIFDFQKKNARLSPGVSF
jgi:hypothetical protein